MSAWRAGTDEGAFDALVQRHGPGLFGFLVRLTGREEVASEAYADTFVKMLRDPDAIRDGAHLRPWLFTVGRRCAQDALRVERRRLRAAVAWGREPRERALPSAESGVASQEVSDLIWTTVERLPEPHRSAVMLRYRHDFTTAEIGSILELTEKQVRDKLVYARRLLREALERGLAS